MPGRAILAACILAASAFAVTSWTPQEARAAHRGQPTDWQRFYYYPYLYYPHNFQRPQGSYDHLYYRYAPDRRIPVYSDNFHNFYPSERPYHMGHHFLLDVF